MSLELSVEEISKIIDGVNLGGRIVLVENHLSEKVPVFIRHCSTADRVYADYIYDYTYEKALEDGFLSVEETIDIMRNRGLFSNKDDNEIRDLQKQIDAQKKVLERTTRVPARRERLKGIISSLESKISEIFYKKELLLGHTAERRAQEEKFQYLLWKGSYKAKNIEVPIWNTKKEFDEEVDIKFRQELFSKYMSFYYGINTKIVRYIARHPLWRMRYVTSMKTGSDLFSTPISEYTIDQLSLVYWSNYYQSVYEMPSDEMPSEGIVNDDEALDAFMENYMTEKKREALASKEGNKDGSKKLSAWDHGNVIVTKSHEAFNDIKYDDPIEAKRAKGKTSIADKEIGKEGKRIKK